MAAAAQILPFPSETDAELARVSGRRLADLVSRNQPLTLHVREQGEDTVLELPATAVKLLFEILQDMAAGKAVAIVPHATELTTQQAADYLNVSRPFLIKLLAEKQLPFRSVGTHRRILFQDVMAYKKQIDEARRRSLDELAALSQELDMGY